MGRARTFDTDVALDAAMVLFWRKGYEATSLSDLTEAMGINRPSLYAAFGNKEELFGKALERYGAGPSAYVREALEQPTGREVAEALLRGAADLQTDPRTPAGCLAVQGAGPCGDDASHVGRTLVGFRLAGDAVIRARFEQARAEGDLPAGADPEELSDFIRTVIYGMAVQAASGATRDDLERVIRRAMRSWPD
jgi:AcrR family transcriptional regulator